MTPKPIVVDSLTVRLSLVPAKSPRTPAFVEEVDHSMNRPHKIVRHLPPRCFERQSCAMHFQSFAVVDESVDADRSDLISRREQRPWSVPDHLGKMSFCFILTSFKSCNVLTPSRTFSAFSIGACTKVLRAPAPRLPWCTPTTESFVNPS
jgi:hypothetical protein